jgi:hypothetical protein
MTAIPQRTLHYAEAPLCMRRQFFKDLEEVMNTSLRVFVYLTGVYSLLIGAFHIMFWRLKFFNWAEELPKLSRLNSGVVQLMNLGLIAIMLVMAFISFFHNKELLGSSLGKTILIGFSLVWFLRFIEHFVFYGASGIPFSIIFLLGFLLYLIPAVGALVAHKP